MSEHIAQIKKINNILILPNKIHILNNTIHIWYTYTPNTEIKIWNTFNKQAQNKKKIVKVPKIAHPSLIFHGLGENERII